MPGCAASAWRRSSFHSPGLSASARLRARTRRACVCSRLGYSRRRRRTSCLAESGLRSRSIEKLESKVPVRKSCFLGADAAKHACFCAVLASYYSVVCGIRACARNEPCMHAHARVHVEMSVATAPCLSSSGGWPSTYRCGVLRCTWLPLPARRLA